MRKITYLTIIIFTSSSLQSNAVSFKNDSKYTASLGIGWIMKGVVSNRSISVKPYSESEEDFASVFTEIQAQLGSGEEVRLYTGATGFATHKQFRAECPHIIIGKNTNIDEINKYKYTYEAYGQPPTVQCSVEKPK